MSGPVAREPEPRPGAIAVRRILTAVRRHIVLTLAVTTCATTVAFIMFREPANFQAQAVLRLVGERQAVAPDLDPSPDLDVRHVVLVNSLVPRVRSRGIIGAVVDSMGLQVRPVPVFSLLHPASQPDLGLTGIHVRPDVKADTVTLQFAEDYLTVRHADSSARQAYGRPINAGGAMFIVPKAPDVAGAVLAIDPRDVAIDRVLLQLSVVPLINTDALNVRYIDSDPRRAMDITNGVVRNFYASTINSSQEMGRRRRLFLQAQLQEAEQQYSQAQAGLTAFRSRQRLASSSDKLARQQADLMTLDTRRGDLEADRAVFRSLVSRLDAAKDSASREQLDAMAFAPEIATDAVVGKMFQQLQTYRSRLDSLTSGPYPSSATNPDVL
ncbi:MAG: hypothetical protein ACREOQ_20940, partial [Gemmatimonadales bacterium]